MRTEEMGEEDEEEVEDRGKKTLMPSSLGKEKSIFILAEEGASSGILKSIFAKYQINNSQ